MDHACSDSWLTLWTAPHLAQWTLEVSSPGQRGFQGWAQIQGHRSLHPMPSDFWTQHQEHSKWHRCKVTAKLLETQHVPLTRRVHSAKSHICNVQERIPVFKACLGPIAYWSRNNRILNLWLFSKIYLKEEVKVISQATLTMGMGVGTMTLRFIIRNIYLVSVIVSDPGLLKPLESPKW